MQVPLALEFIATDATLKVELIAGHVNVLQVLLEVARGAIGALADRAGQGLKAAHDPWGWRERRAVSPGEPGSSNSSSTAAQHQQRATATPPSHHKPTASCWPPRGPARPGSLPPPECPSGAGRQVLKQDPTQLKSLITPLASGKASPGLWLGRPAGRAPRGTGNNLTEEDGEWRGTQGTGRRAGAGAGLGTALGE